MAGTQAQELDQTTLIEYSAIVVYMCFVQISYFLLGKMTTKAPSLAQLMVLLCSSASIFLFRSYQSAWR